tara:strand:+ start:451 stop:699 length:249 start_codon:yes stop_codon:yes gene_type:complete
MKMDIVESDLKQLFMWIKNLQELCKSQNALIESHQDIIESLEKRIDYGYEKLEKRINNIEHDLQLVHLFISSSVKDRKNSTH